MRSPSTVLLRTQSDARLVALARAGHDRAFEAIVERYRRPLLRACRRILPEARAEDALQQALVAAWTALRRGDEVHELRPWLYKVVRNTALNQLRVTGHDLDELVGTLAAAGDPEEEVERRALVRQTLAAVAALPDRQRDALLRTAIEGRGQDEVARDLGLTDTALRQLVHRARVSVRAAATAVVPLPAAAWLASAAPRAEPMAARIVELVAGSGAAGATMAKAGAVAVLAGSAVGAPALVDRPPRERTAAPAQAAKAAAEPAAAVVALPARAEPAPTPEPPEVVKISGQEGDRAGGHRGDDERSGPDRDERAEGERRERGDDEHGDRDRDDVRRERSDDDRDERDGDRDDRGDESSGDGGSDESSGGDGSDESPGEGGRDEPPDGGGEASGGGESSGGEDRAERRAGDEPDDDGESSAEDESDDDR